MQKKQDTSLETAKLLYSNITKQQGNPEEHLIRCDWKFFKNNMFHYVYTLPYLPYFAYNSGVTYAKEAVVFPALLFIGGTKHQDYTDRKLSRIAGYETFFKKIWLKEHESANFVNMDKHEYGVTNIRHLVNKK